MPFKVRVELSFPIDFKSHKMTISIKTMLSREFAKVKFSKCSAQMLRGIDLTRGAVENSIAQVSTVPLFGFVE